MCLFCMLLLRTLDISWYFFLREIMKGITHLSRQGELWGVLREFWALSCHYDVVSSYVSRIIECISFILLYGYCIRRFLKCAHGIFMFSAGVCIYVYVYVYIYVCTYIYIYIYICRYTGDIISQSLFLDPVTPQEIPEMIKSLKKMRHLGMMKSITRFCSCQWLQ